MAMPGYVITLRPVEQLTDLVLKNEGCNTKAVISNLKCRVL